MNLIKDHTENELNILIQQLPDLYKAALQSCEPELIALLLKLQQCSNNANVRKTITHHLNKAIPLLIHFYPITPLTGLPNEWVLDKLDNEGKLSYYNKRYRHVYKYSDGLIYNKRAIKWVYNELEFYGEANAFGGSGVISSKKQIVKFPIIPKTFKIVVDKINGKYFIHDDMDILAVNEHYD